VGDDLPILVKHESQESIDLYARNASTGPKPGWHDLHTDEEFAEKSIFGGRVNTGVATMAYVAELLEKAFPVRSLMSYGSRLEMRATEPIRSGDTITFTGEVTGKREEDGRRLVECEVIGTNQLNLMVARAKAIVPL
jgi:acyl dehydratase